MVQRGDTIYRIAERYGTSVDAIVQANHITDFAGIEVGTRLVIPGANRDETLASLMPFRPPDLRAQAHREADLAFDWPIYGHFSSGFGWRGIGSHEGIEARRVPQLRHGPGARISHRANEN